MRQCCSDKSANCSVCALVAIFTLTGCSVSELLVNILFFPLTALFAYANLYLALVAQFESFTRFYDFGLLPTHFTIHAAVLTYG